MVGMSDSTRSRLRLVASIALLVVVLVAVPVLIALMSRPKPPEKLYHLFPSHSAICFVLDTKKMLPVMPREYLEALPPRTKAFVSSSKVTIAASEDLAEIYILLDGALPLDETASLISDGAKRTSVAGYPAYLFESGCVVELSEGSQFFVLCEESAKIADQRLRNAATEKNRLSKNLISRFEDPSKDVFARAFGFPGNNTPSLLPGSFFYDLQNDVSFFSLAARRNEEGLVQIKLLLYFPERSARDLYYLQMPTLLSQFSEDYPDLARIIADIDIVNVKEDGLQLMVTVPPEVIEPFFDTEGSQPPATTPFIPELSELPF
ncbi:MAG: hypothetical protein Kow00107_05500 [Planctomycetota bacterium]